MCISPGPVLVMPPLPTSAPSTYRPTLTSVLLIANVTRPGSTRFRLSGDRAIECHGAGARADESAIKGNPGEILGVSVEVDEPIAADGQRLVGILVVAEPTDLGGNVRRKNRERAEATISQIGSAY